jgi:hypothetical protein
MRATRMPRAVERSAPGLPGRPYRVNLIVRDGRSAKVTSRDKSWPLVRPLHDRHTGHG